MKLEVERKFVLEEKIVSKLDQLASAKRRLRQGYLIVGDPEVRVRQDDHRFLITVKAGSGLVRPEQEDEISEHLFNALWDACGAKWLEKDRYEVDIEGYPLEIDVYTGKLTGLITAEIEFASTEVAVNFNSDILKKHFGRVTEVTGNKQFKNANLVTADSRPTVE